MKLSIIIPSVGDPVLPRTIEDIQDKAKTRPEVIVVWGKECGMRTAINKGVAKSRGEYIAKCDDHCMFDEGFDVKILEHIKDNQIVVPVRYALDVDKWEVMDDRPVVHERLSVNKEDVKGVRWVTRTRQKKDEMIAEDMTFQGSFYMMSRKHWDNMGNLEPDKFFEFGKEAQELSLKTWEVGGRVIKNKYTWYAHKHRKFGRIYAPGDTRKSKRLMLDYYLKEKKDILDSYLEHFHEN